MIFIILGSQKFQFNRLLKTVDRLIDTGVIKEEVLAQVGFSDYIPHNFEYKKYFNYEEMSDLIQKADIIVTHGGSGSIVRAVKAGKKTIAIPRKAKYKEHVDDHQIQIIEQFSVQNLICACEDCEQLETALEKVRNTTYKSYQSSSGDIINSIVDFIENNQNDISAFDWNVGVKNENNYDSYQ